MLVLSIAAVLVIKWSADANFFAGYDPELPLLISGFEEAAQDGYVRETLQLNSFRKQTIPVRLARPLEASRRMPCIIFLHGIGQDQTFLDTIARPFTDAGFVLVTFDQYLRGQRKISKGFRKITGIRKRAALTVLETRRLVDYLQTRPDVHPDRIYLIGASFGAITGCTAAAMEPRIRATVLTYGGGDLPKLFAGKETRELLGNWSGLVRTTAAWWMKPADPMRYVDRLEGRPVLFQNGERDQIIPMDSAEALQDAAPEPKTIVWYDSEHVGLDAEHVKRVIADSIDWITQQDAAFTANSAKTAEKLPGPVLIPLLQEPTGARSS